MLLQTKILHLQLPIQGITKKCCIARGAARLPPNNYTHKAKCATTLTCRPLITALPLSLSLRLPLSLLLLEPSLPHKTSSRVATNVNRQKSLLHSQAAAYEVYVACF